MYVTEEGQIRYREKTVDQAYERRMRRNHLMRRWIYHALATSLFQHMNDHEEVVLYTDNGSQSSDWIGVDLNATGHLAVVAHPASGGVVMLGRQPELGEGKYANPRKRYSSTSKHKRARRLRERERNIRGDLNQNVAKEIVKMARQLWCGIKLEDLAGAGFAGLEEPGTPLLFSRHKGSFYHLQKTIETRAKNTGVQVAYVDPSLTSLRCSQCGERGSRRGKDFSCSQCGYSAHADENAAFNIAKAPPTGG